MLLAAYTMRDGIVRAKRVGANMIAMAERAEKNKSEIDVEEMAIQYRSFYAAILDIINGGEELRSCLDDYLYAQSNYNHISSYMKNEAMPLLEEGPNVENIARILEDCKRDLAVAESDLPRLREGYQHLNREYNRGYIQDATSFVENYLYEIAMRSITVKGTEPVQVLELLQGAEEDTERILRTRHAQIPNAKYYAFGLPEEDKYRVQDLYERLALGQMKGSTISNGVFDAMILNIKTELSKPENNAMFIKKEKLLVRDASKYLRPGGLLIMSLPYFRLHRDLSVFIAKNYKNVQVRKANGDKFQMRGHVLILAERKNDVESGSVDESTVEYLRGFWDPDKIPNILDHPYDPFTLEGKNLEIKFFRGSTLDMEELAGIVKTSSATAEFWEKQTQKAFSDQSRNPLLPFNVGQLGLVLTSGSLDGIIDEGYGNYHVVKGRVVKTTDTQREAIAHTGGDRVQVTSTISNRVEINVMLPDGTHKILA